MAFIDPIVNSPTMAYPYQAAATKLILGKLSQSFWVSFVKSELEFLQIHEVFG